MDIGAHHLLPARVREVFEGGAPAGAGVVDEKVDAVKALTDGACQTLYSLSAGEVGGDR